jgi:ATP-binding cassette subfamily F protein 3
MIALSNISFDFGGHYLLKDASWHIKPNERIGLVGLNGAGKSTLFRIITEEYPISDGEMSKGKNLKIGYLNQDMLSFDTNDSILEVALTAYEEQLELQKRIDKLIEVCETDYSDEVIEELTEAQEKFASMGGYEMQTQTEIILEGLGFSTSDLQRPFDEFSGGWRMRVLLAKILLQNPDLLLLDEPTNHLDMPSIEWLENYLTSYKGTVIMISHDRYFLDRMVTKIVEVAHKDLFEYTGNYESFLTQKVERDELLKRRFENQQIYIKQQEKFIEKFKAKASKATQAQSKLKQLDKLERIAVIEDESVDLRLKFDVKQKSGKTVVELKKVSKSFGDLEVLRNASIQISRGDKIALIGANGIGKSTLLRIIHKTEPVTGEVEYGHNVMPTVYAQHQLESLTLKNSIIEELEEGGYEKSEPELRNILGCFMFKNDDVFKKIKMLSGGEKARVSLAKTLLEQANFMLLDEPTNHLDMQSINLLTTSLQKYDGTLLLISHNRHFISEIANKIWYIEDKILKEYPGTFNEYREWNDKREKTSINNKVKEETKAKPQKTQNNSKQQSDQDQQNKKKISKLESQLNNIEFDIENLAKEKKALEDELMNPENTSDLKKIAELGEKHQDIEKSLTESNEKFETVFEELLPLKEQT